MKSAINDYLHQGAKSTLSLEIEMMLLLSTTIGHIGSLVFFLSFKWFYIHQIWNIPLLLYILHESVAAFDLLSSLALILEPPDTLQKEA